ncbi:MAG: hypothetical protein DRJ11_09770 [Candidatus Aminicenantes bacterium]|nr:MAG: hypothetical protein DRJ11_09770 [Candidatus Aminicenantes bacterium]
MIQSFLPIFRPHQISFILFLSIFLFIRLKFIRLKYKFILLKYKKIVTYYKTSYFIPLRINVNLIKSGRPGPGT